MEQGYDEWIYLHNLSEVDIQTLRVISLLACCLRIDGLSPDREHKRWEKGRNTTLRAGLYKGPGCGGSLPD